MTRPSSSIGDRGHTNHESEPKRACLIWNPIALNQKRIWNAGGFLLNAVSIIVPRRIFVDGFLKIGFLIYFTQAQGGDPNQVNMSFDQCS